MMNVLQAIRSEQRASSTCLQSLQKLVDTNDEYLSKVRRINRS